MTGQSDRKNLSTNLKITEIKNELKTKISGEIEIREEILTKYATDASLFRVQPKMIIYPKDKYEIQTIVKYVNENKYKYKC